MEDNKKKKDDKKQKNYGQIIVIIYFTILYICVFIGVIEAIILLHKLTSF
jgi:hypothetical protein